MEISYIPSAQAPGLLCCLLLGMCLHIPVEVAHTAGSSPVQTLLHACIHASCFDGALNPAQGQHRTAIQHLQRVLEISGAMGDHVVRPRAC